MIPDTSRQIRSIPSSLPSSRGGHKSFRNCSGCCGFYLGGGSTGRRRAHEYSSLHPNGGVRLARHSHRRRRDDALPEHDPARDLGPRDCGRCSDRDVRWRGYGWGYRGYGWGYGGYRSYGWGWRRPNYGGAIAAGAIAGGILGLAAAASTPYYGYSYPAYYGYYPAYRRVYYRPAYYRPVYYRRAYYRPVYYRRAYWRPVLLPACVLVVTRTSGRTPLPLNGSPSRAGAGERHRTGRNGRGCLG